MCSKRVKDRPTCAYCKQMYTFPTIQLTLISSLQCCQIFIHTFVTFDLFAFSLVPIHKNVGRLFCVYLCSAAAFALHIICIYTLATHSNSTTPPIYATKLYSTTHVALYSHLVHARMSDCLHCAHTHTHTRCVYIKSIPKLGTGKKFFNYLYGRFYTV